MDNFGLVKQLRFMTLITSLIDGYKNEYLNFEDNSQNKELLRRLSMIQMKQKLRDAEDTKLTPGEEESIEEFFRTEI